MYILCMKARGGIRLTVSIEWFLLENVAVNIPILWASLRLCGARVRAAPVLAASAFGALYGALALGGGLPLLRALPAQAFAAAAMAALAHGVRDFRSTARVMFFIWIMTFFFGGAGLSIATLLGARGFSFSPWVLVIAFPCAMIAAALAMRLKRPLPASLDIEVTLEGHAYVFRALIDTGNHLIEPFSGLPVMLVSPAAALKMNLLDTLTPERAASLRLRLIPYHSVGKREGVLTAVKPERISLRRERASEREMYLAISRNPLDCEGGFDAILPP